MRLSSTAKVFSWLHWKSGADALFLIPTGHHGREGTLIIDWRKVVCPAVVLGAVTFLIHLAFNGGYGISRDELYFIVCGQRLAWGYVDQPPLVPLIAAWSYALAGDWLTGFRLVPALTMAITVGLTADFARLIGGGRFAQILAGLCALAAPVFLADGLFVSTDMFQPLTWLGVAWCLVRLAQTNDQRWWIALGLVVAFSLWSKYAIVFFVAALAVGAVFTPLRKSLTKPWVYAAAVLVAVLVLPNILWQQNHGWPFLELGSAGVHGKNRVLPVGAFFGQQLLLMGPTLALVWIAGLWKFAVKPAHAAYRVFPIAFVLLAAFFIVEHGKATYMMAIYPMLFASGAVFWESVLEPLWARGIALFLAASMGVMLAPLVLPVLSEEGYIAYAEAIGISPKATAGENLKLARLPQHFADMHGWPQMAAKVAAVYHALPPADRAKAVFFGTNYGEAAAIDVYGRKLGLPPAIGDHNNYWIWGLQGHDGSVIIEIGGTREDHLRDFNSVEQAGELDDPYAMPYETHQPIWVERGLKEPLDKVWLKIKHYG
jgi:hypothetical protein